MFRISTTIVTFFTLILTTLCFAEKGNLEYKDHIDFEHYSVHFTLFDSTFIKPDIAKIYGIKRSKYENILNISVVEKGQYGGLPAKLSGTVTNLMQQQKPLKFIEIKEETVTYYLVSITTTSKEVVHFDILVTPDGADSPLEVKFSKTLYPN